MEEKDIKQTTEYIDISRPTWEEFTPDLPAPEDGKAWRRKSDGFIFHGEVFLGKLWFINGELLEKPIAELPEHFEQIEIDE